MFKKLVLLVVLFVFIRPVQSQDSGISIELHYPLVLIDSEHYQGDNPNGLLGAAFQFQFTDNDRFNFGAEYKFDTAQGVKSTGGINGGGTVAKQVYMFNHINLFSKITLDDEERLKAYVDGGFSVFDFAASSKNKYLGFNGGLGLSYDIMDRIYMFVNYNYVNATKKSQATDYSQKATLNMIRVGVGFNL